MLRIKELLNWINFQNWKHLFESPAPQLHEEEVGIFYHNLVIYDDGLYLMSQINEVDMGLDKDTLSEIFGVPTTGIKSIRSGEGSAQFL